MKIHRNRWTAVGLACLLAVSAGAAPFTEWTGMTVYAADTVSSTCGENLTWKLENGTLTISGTGAMNNYASSAYVPWYSSRKSITAVSIENGVTSIGDYCFYNMQLNSVTIPNSVMSIGAYAFKRCLDLSSITIPGSVTSIGEHAFDGCSCLSSITIPNSVTSIGEHAFEGCIKLNSITIPNSVTRIEGGVFINCTGLSSITIPNSVTSIGAYAFSNCPNLNSVTFHGTEAQWETIRNSFQASINVTLHKHTVDNSNWTFDQTHHWHQCTVSECPAKGSDLQDDYAKHTWSNGKCTVCEYVCSHTLVKTASKPPTCTEVGNIEYWTCSECGLRWKDSDMTIELADGGEVIKALGHHYPTTPAQADWQKNDTSHWLVCDRENCPDQTGSISQKAAHTFSGDICCVCGYKRTHVHDLTYVAAQDATCTTDGNLAYYECSGCDSLFEDKTALKATSAGKVRIPANGHHYPTTPTQMDWQKDKTSHWLICDLGEECSDLAGSIKEQAEHTYQGDVCSVCGFEREHVHVLTPVAAQDATCTDDGNFAYYECSGCNGLFEDADGSTQTSLEDVRIPALGHSWSLEHDAEGHWEVCTVCQTASEKTAHSFAENTCTVCGYQKPDDTQTNTNTVTRSDSRDHDDDKGSSTNGSWVMNEKGWYFKRNNGSYPKECWMKLGWLGAESWYYFDSDGYMKTGWLDRNGERYYLNPIIGTNSGKMLTGWQLIDGKWYYFSTEAGAGEGRLLRNTTTPDHYQVDQDGVWQP